MILNFFLCVLLSRVCYQLCKEANSFHSQYMSKLSIHVEEVMPHGHGAGFRRKAVYLSPVLRQ